MALKDWKKLGKDEWQNNHIKSNGEGIILRINFYNEEEYSKFVVEWGRYEKGKILNVYDTSGFDTKSQALAFAKKYMRSH